jgi:tetrahydromethanopterin S-methyltransferase subunit A
LAKKQRVKKVAEVKFDIESPEKIPLDEIEGKWPIYEPKEVILGNPKSPIAISTLWTERQRLEKILEPSEFSAIGQTFSPRGVSLMFRDLLANPNIRSLVVYGRDGTNTGDYIKTFFEVGFNEDYTYPKRRTRAFKKKCSII